MKSGYPMNVTLSAFYGDYKNQPKPLALPRLEQTNMTAQNLMASTSHMFISDSQVLNGSAEDVTPHDLSIEDVPHRNQNWHAGVI